MVGEVTLSITRSWVQNLSLPDERLNRETSRRIGFYSVYLVSLQGLPFTLLYFSYIQTYIGFSSFTNLRSLVVFCYGTISSPFLFFAARVETWLLSVRESVSVSVC